MTDAIRSPNNATSTAPDRTASTRRTLLVLLAHGSSDPAWQAPFVAMTQSIATNQPHPVRLAFMELCSPGLEDIARELPAHESCDVEVLPLFFSAGRHLRRDVPLQIEQLHQSYPWLNIRLHDPVGIHPRMTQALTDIAADLDFSDQK